MKAITKWKTHEKKGSDKKEYDPHNDQEMWATVAINFFRLQIKWLR